MSEQASRRPPGTPLPVVPAGGRFEGMVAFRGLARIEGEVVGSVEGAGRVEVGESGHVAGPVTADELVSRGRIEGDVVARDIARLDAGATLSGTLETPRVSVENGALIQGRCSVGSRPG